MILPVIKYGHPVLRKKGDRIDSISPAISQLIADMIETMHSARGIGLAAQQVGQAIQLAVFDLRGVTDRPSSLEIGGQAADVDSIMPLALINPQVTPVGDPATGPEGCLSFPEMFADITRPASIHVKAVNERGEPLAFHCGGLLARAVQHELDHLRGILFIDRMTADDKMELKPKLEALHAATKAELAAKKK